MANEASVILMAVGDVVGYHNDPESAYELVGPVLRQADIRFANNERHYTARTDLVLPDHFTEITRREHANALRSGGGFDVLAFASNHSMDLGPRVMLETVDLLQKLGVAVIGAGKDLEEARKPAIVERKGTTVAFLARCSVLRKNANATAWRPGVAPMRAWTLYNQVDYQPGTAPQILTFANKDDLESLVEDVKRAKAQADVVAVSLHWGIHLTHAIIAMYEKEVAHAVIDAGADMILGHGPHLLKGIEVYKGKPIVYSMGNFAFDLPLEVFEEWASRSEEMAAFRGHYKMKTEPGWELLGVFPAESRKSMIVKVEIAGKQVQRVSLLPVLINQRAQPHVVKRADRGFDEVLEYIEDITESEGLAAQFAVERDEIVVRD